jgi:acetyltransferase-like isoleucine patch superfamily enzyme
MTDDELLAALRRLYLERERGLKERFDRSISFADAVLDNRWTRAARLGFSSGVSIYDSALVFGDVTVGKDTWIGPATILDGGGGGLSIGASCSIAAGVHIYTHDTVLWAISGGKAPQRQAPVAIGDNCHIGAQSIILPGVRIGRKCIVAANSLVNGDVADGTLVGGSPARVIGYVEGEGEQVTIRVDSTLSSLSTPQKSRYL